MDPQNARMDEIMSEEVSESATERRQKKSRWWDIIVGNYEWAFLCTPRLTGWGKRKLPPFYGKDEEISLLLAAIMGLQHALAMVGGIITPPLIISKSAGFSTQSQASKHVIATLTSCTCNGVSCSVNGSCKSCLQELEGKCLSGEDAYGHILGTIVICCWLQVAASFCSPRILSRIFPPIVTGTCIILIGVSLLATGFEYWGGGAYCADQILTTKALCTGNGDVDLPFGHRNYVGLGFIVFSTLILIEMFGSPFLRNTQVIIGLAIGMIVASSIHVTHCEANCSTSPCKDICYDVLPEEVKLQSLKGARNLGATLHQEVSKRSKAPRQIQGLHYNSSTNTISGMPKSVYQNGTICIQHCSPAMCNNIVCHKYRYVTSTKITSAHWVSFLWAHTFPLKFYPPALLPLILVMVVATMECIGDVTATIEASRLEPFGLDFEKSIQGAILADGLSAFWAALGTMTPVTTYAQNNGVISLSHCASRRAGLACCMWLFILGVFSKFAAILVSIPDSVLGGMTTFLFTSVLVSGIRVLNLKEGLTRRNRFIVIISLGLGLGVSLVPTWVNISGQVSYPFEGNLWPVRPKWSEAYHGFRDAIMLILSNGFSLGGLMAIFLNLILPYDYDEKSS